MSLPSEREIDDRLRRWGLVREDDSPHAPATSKNRTLICRRGARRRVLVKIADGPANVGVLREGGVLELLEKELPHGGPLEAARLFAFDRRLGLVAVEWLEHAQTLHHYHRQSGRYGAELARQI